MSVVVQKIEREPQVRSWRKNGPSRSPRALNFMPALKNHDHFKPLDSLSNTSSLHWASAKSPQMGHRGLRLPKFLAQYTK
jgi:hypothetical protein